MLKGIDRFLATILSVIFFIILFAVVLVWRSPTSVELEYSAGAAPEDVVHNLVVAATRGDNDRAKSYLSPEVLEDIEEREKDSGYSLLPSRRSGLNTGVRLVVEEAETVEGLATVRVNITTWYSRPTPLGLLGVFESNRYSREVEVRLRQIDGEWKVVKPFDVWMLHNIVA